MKRNRLPDGEISNGFKALPDLEWQKARKREVLVSVVFCEESITVPTLEGLVRCEPGDAILTGVHGELWPVSRELFEMLYEPVFPALMGKDGQYCSLPHTVEVARLSHQCRIFLSGNMGSLNGTNGDWLVRQEDGSMGIVASDIFSKTYNLIE
jgi:hypothetical protein